MIDAQGEVDIVKIAPVLGNLDVLDIGVRQFSIRTLRAVPPADINAVVILGLFIALPGGERLKGVRLIKGVVDFLLALVRVAAPRRARAVVLVVAGEGKEQTTPVLVLGLVHPRRYELNLYLVGIFIDADDAAPEKIDRAQLHLILVSVRHKASALLYKSFRERAHDEVGIDIFGIEQLVAV